MLALATALVNELNAILTVNQNWKIVPQANGQLVSEFPTGTPPPPPPPAIATIPNFTNKSAAFSVPLSQYVSNAYTSLQLIGTLPTGWTFSSTTLAYSGTGVGTATLQLQANWAGPATVSNTFTVQSVAAVTPDTVAPTIPTGLSALLSGGSVAISFNPASDPAPPGIGWSGMAQYQLQRSINGGAFSNLGAPINAVNNGVDFFPTPQDLGAPSNAGSTTQTGASFAMTGYGASYYSTFDQGQVAPFPITGNFLCTFKVTSFACASSAFAKTGVDCRGINPNDAVNGTGSPHVFATVKPLVTGTGGSIDYRATQGGTTSNTGDVAQPVSTPLWVMFTRVGNVFTQWISTNPNLLGSVATQVAQITVTLPGQIYLMPVCAGTATGVATVQIDQWNVSQAAIVTATDSTVPTNATAAYQVNAIDATGNVSAYSPSVTVSSTSSTLGYLQSLNAASPPYLLICQQADLYLSTPAGGAAKGPYDQMGGTSAATVNIPNYGGGSTGKAPAGIGVSMGNNTAGAIKSNATPNPFSTVYGGSGINIDGVTVGQDWKSTSPKGIVALSSWFMNPFTNTSATPSAAQITQMLTANSAGQNAFFVYIDSLATLSKKIPGSVLYRPFVENNGTFETYGPQIGNTNQIALYQLIHNRMTGAPNNVTNIIWCYNVNDSFGGPVAPNSFLDSYPGDSYVDVMSWDTYTATPGTHAVSSGCYAAMISKGKPVIMFEAGAGTQNTAGIYDNNAFLNDLMTNCPKVVAVFFWTQNWALSLQPGASSIMSSSKVITRSMLPALS